MCRAFLPPPSVNKVSFKPNCPGFHKYDVMSEKRYFKDEMNVIVL